MKFKLDKFNFLETEHNQAVCIEGTPLGTASVQHSDAYYNGLKQYFFDEYLKEHGYMKMALEHYVKLEKDYGNGMYSFLVIHSNLVKQRCLRWKEDILAAKPAAGPNERAIQKYFKEYIYVKEHVLREGDIIRFNDITGVVSDDGDTVLDMGGFCHNVEDLPNKIEYLGNIYNLEGGETKWI